MIRAVVRREKLVGRETEAREHVADVAVDGARALLFRNAVVEAGDQQLRVALQAHDRELAA